MTLEDWADWDDRGEVVDGRLVEEELPSNVHDVIVVWLIAMLRPWVCSRGGWLFSPEVKYAVTSTTGRKADVSIFLPASTPPDGDASLNRLPPDVAIEVVSKRARDQRRDRIEKVAEYSRFGVRYYWLVDIKKRTVEILELGPRRAKPVTLLSVKSGTHAIPGCPGLRLRFDDLWAEVDRLKLKAAKRTFTNKLFDRDPPSRPQRKRTPR